VLAIHLLGRRPGDWFRDGVVRDWTHAYVFAYYGDRPFDGDSVCELLHADRFERMSPSEYHHHASRLIETVLSPGEAHAVLRRLVAAEIEHLTDRLDVLKDREARDLEDRIDMARVDSSPEGRNRRNYMAAAVRNMKALRLELEALQARPERGAAPAVPAAAEEVPGGTEAKSADAPRAAEEVSGGTEAKSAGAPETAGGPPEPAPPARPAVWATMGTLALMAWEVIRHQLE
jgi:hypothetical protein